MKQGDLNNGIVAAFVFVITVALRVPSCFESFWVDELHSTWTVWSELEDVFPRAKIGNQTPFYFVGLWFWKQAVGETELALRFTSVLATALAASLMSFELARWTKSLIAGVTAGLVLSAETNAIFFGTELRPYAVVILASTIAVLCFMRLMSRKSDDTNNLPWIGLVLVTLFAALCQPTSLGVLGWLFAGLAVWNLATRRMTPRFSLINVLLTTAVLAVGWTLWQNTLASTWRLRSNWESFATAPAWADAANLWSWGWLWLIPIALVFVPCGRWLSTDYSKRQRITIASVAGVCLVATFFYWYASRMDWVHLWHRRYAVALLPMFSILVGTAAGRFQNSKTRFQIPALATALTLLTGLTYSQGVIQTVINNPRHLAYRGEDWRGAIDWINQHTTTNDRLFLDSGLIEAKRWVPHMYPLNWEPASFHEQYMLLPVSGPYETQLFYPINSDSDTLCSTIYYDARIRRQQVIDVDFFPSLPRRIVFMSRRPAHQQALKSIKEIGSKYIDADSIDVHGFGGVSIVTIPLSDEESSLSSAIDSGL